MQNPLPDTFAKQHKPSWIRVRIPRGENYDFIRNLKAASGLHTVCESALCPNIGECWQDGHATFMILGDGCTRSCAFCGVGKDTEPVCGDEPLHVAGAVESMGLTHAVVTSVTRDDLADGGAGHFAATIGEIRNRCPRTSIEVLIPDFGGSRTALETVITAGPDIIGHNMETVPRLYPAVRPGAEYGRSLRLLSRVREMQPACITKSGLMLGLGETESEIHESIRELRAAGVHILTLGQYLRPGKRNAPVSAYHHPEIFARLKAFALQLGFSWVAAGPLVRSSYQAARQARALGVFPGRGNGSAPGPREADDGLEYNKARETQ